MKYLLSITILLFNLSTLPGQITTDSVLLETKSKTQMYYVELSNSEGKVYEMGKYLDKAGSGYAIRKTDTLTRQPGGAYLGNYTKITRDNNRFFLIVQKKKVNKYILDTTANLVKRQTNLNNAYYLDHFFSMCDELNKTYPLNHYSFRNGFYTWEELQHKESDPLQFRTFADTRLKNIKDSISYEQSQYVALTNSLIRNIETIDYNSLKDNLTKLPATFSSTSWYYGTVVNEVSKRRPEYFFKLAEDFPNNRNVIFAAAKDNKEVIQSLKSVENHTAIKKEFFKDRKFGKRMPYKIIATYTIVIGLITLLIVSQK